MGVPEAESAIRVPESAIDVPDGRPREAPFVVRCCSTGTVRA